MLIGKNPPSALNRIIRARNGISLGVIFEPFTGNNMSRSI